MANQVFYYNDEIYILEKVQNHISNSITCEGFFYKQAKTMNSDTPARFSVLGRGFTLSEAQENMLNSVPGEIKKLAK